MTDSISSVPEAIAPLYKYDSFPVYQCHKEVRASKILKIEPVGVAHFEAACEHGKIILHESFVERHHPLAGGYLVVNADGCVSYSPSKAFEEGYTMLDDIRYQPTDAVEREKLQKCAERLIELGGLPKSNGMTFGEAIESLKRGNRVARSGWNGKSMWLSLSGDSTREITADKFWSKNNADYATEQGGAAKVLPCITMKTATGEILMGWLASQTDMLASDWQEV